MTIVEMLKQSALLTALGMTVVFAFLWFMIICVNLIAQLVHKMGWDKDVRPLPDVSFPPKNTGGAAAPETTAVITAAVTDYRDQEEARHE
jgi:sodium pump decarboxylase gamma subunit